MFLSKVELNGFKSFADKTVFEFDRGITAVLGPNGCGKSNVVDACKWVLGETSAKNLRGTEMQDVIFAGSADRKPCGMAEVNLFFDNEDGGLPIEFNEVCITRRLYRSGESEYLLNKQPCRKRDITELFLDTGIGRSAYSFIEQGKVEALLQAKPAERRIVFEEAAGISKYKARRKETLARLDRTNQYLFRVRDIVEEVEKNIRRVARQAASARRFQKLDEELRGLKSVHFVRSYKTLNAKLNELRTKKAEIDALLGKEQAAQAEVGKRIAELTKNEMDLSETMDKHESSMKEVREALMKIQLELTSTRERTTALQREADDAEARAKTLTERLATMEAEEKEASESLQTARTDASGLQETLAERERVREEMQRNFREAEESLETIRKALAAIAEERSKLQNEQTMNERERATLTETLHKQESREQELADTERTADGELAGLRSQLDETTATIADLDGRLTRLSTSEAENREAMNTHAETLSAMTAERSGLESRLQTLEDLKNSFSGAYAGVQAALRAGRDGEADCREVIGMAADLISVPTDYAVAIETALGAQAQDVLVETAVGAQAAIEYLKRSRAGRATFLPLDRIRPRRRLDENVRRLAGACGEAIDLVEFDERFRPAMEYLLAGVLIAENLTEARRLAASDARGVRIVTLEGEVINPHGAMTGGHKSGKSAGLVTRNAEMEEIREKLNALTPRLAATAHARARASEQAAADAAAITQHRQDREKSLDEKRSVENRLSLTENNLNRVREESAALSAQRSTARERLTVLTEDATRFGSELARLDETSTERKEAFEKAEAARIEARETLDRDSEAMAELREKRAEAQSRAEELARRVETLARDRQERQDELKQRGEFVERARTELEVLSERKSELEKQEVEDLRRREELEGQGTKLRNGIATLREQLNDNRTEERASQVRIGQIHDAQSDLKLEEQDARLKLEQVTERARDELQITDLADRAARLPETIERGDTPVDENGEALPNEEGAEGDGDEEEGDISAALTQDDDQTPYMSDEQIREAISATQRKIENIGTVNLYAIDELAELEARQAFLESELEDIEKAAGDLENVIERLNTECHRRFQETFDTVREHFQDMFRTLFGGGSAELILEKVDEENGGDALDAGIDIRARPPGKEPKSISLLSGGEKALCAVALLFALFRCKPSPFCILDEVDGPLDETNIGRFLDVVEDFTSGTQFILISHSKYTMSRVNRIYGVTQKELGVSIKYSLTYEHAEAEIEKVAEQTA